MKAFYIACITTFLLACSPVDITEHSGSTPLFNVQEFFSGELLANGIVKDRRGKVIRTFTATISAQWQGNTGTLDEHFLFSNGEKQQRIWQLKKQSNGTFSATANDVVGQTTLYTEGNALFLEYNLKIDYRGKPLVLKVDDRMYLTSKNMLINESIMTKYGFKVAYVTLAIQKRNRP